jgi:hypothetical protein
MSPTPNDKAFDAASTSSIYSEAAAVPFIDGGGRVFSASQTVALRSTSRNVTLHYTLDGSEPGAISTLYSAPFTIDKTATVRAVVVRDGKVISLPAEAVFLKKPNDWTVKIFSKYNRQYTGGGDEGLIDGIRGTVNFASGVWQGYQGQVLVAVVDLQRPTQINEVGGGFLQSARSWIWMPTAVIFETSTDNQNWTHVADIKTDLAPDDMTPAIRDYTQKITPTMARYVRVTARNYGKIPAWHPGAGGEAFIFVDEIFVR